MLWTQKLFPWQQTVNVNMVSVLSSQNLWKLTRKNKVSLLTLTSLLQVNSAISNFI